MTWDLRLSGTDRPSLIVGGPGALDDFADALERVSERGRRGFLLTDSHVEAAWGPEIRSLAGGALEGALVLEPGEQSKSIRTFERVVEALAAAGCRRDDVLIALGGGVVGDLVGFVAATYHRGIALWQLPTSIVAQTDSSVGGKVAVNLTAGKNLVGCFYQPERVFIDPVFLTTLPHEEVVNGLGEVVKYALLSGDELVSRLEAAAPQLLRVSEETMSDIVRECVAHKAAVVEADEREAGLRATLNLGHTTAHALEALGGYRGLSHGRAVALGLLVSLAVSEEVCALGPETRERVRRLLLELELPVTMPASDVDAVLGAMDTDKKKTAGGRGFVVLEELGRAKWGVDVPDDVLRGALEVIAG